MTDDPYRLPRGVVPHRYTVALQPDLTTATFVGHVVIDATAATPVEHIVLNAIELDLDSVKVDGEDVPYTLDARTERLVIERAAGEGPLTIECSFTGLHNDKLRGFYRSTYVDAEGVTHVLASSQMQSTDCRRVFPCFDEPDFKAVFDVTLIVEPGMLAISNGPEIERVEQDDGLIAVRFAPTMPMSTYLVAFVVGPLEATEPVMVPRPEGGEIPLRIVHVPGKGHLTKFALEVGAFALQWYQDYYGLPYPTDKCDMVAVPDFAAGAMENLGLITYRESLLLADPSISTQLELQNLADVVCHEIAHMWFGDLVTMKWWNGIWLNEAFATFMEIACCGDYRPDWLRWTTFSLERSAAFEVDSLASTRSVEFPVDAPSECAGMFDLLTYQKGGSLLRMLEQYLGPEAFRRGISHYLSTHEYGNTETSDLWDAIEEAVAVQGDGTPVRQLMDSWIWQPGYPLVSAKLDGSRLVLSQQRFAFGDTEDATKFVVPIHLRIDGVEQRVLLDDFEFTVELPSSDSSVVVNAGGHGFFRVHYDPTLLGRIERQLADLTIVDRYNLVDDAWNAVVAGRLAAAHYIDFLEIFRDERDLAVWQAMGVALRGIGRLVEGDAYRAYQQRVADLVRPALLDLGWDPVPGESNLRAKLRGVLVAMLAVLGNDPEAQARCRAIFHEGLTHDPELVSAATNAVAANGSDEDYDDFLGRMRRATTPQEQLRYMYALAEFPDADQMRRTIDFAFTGEVKTQNAPFLLYRCLANRWNGEHAWKALRQRWDEADARFPDSTIVRMIESVKVLTKPDVVADVQGFFAEHPIPQGAKTLDQTLERQRVNAALLERESPRLNERWA